MDETSVLLCSMPFADPLIPSIQLSTLESYLRERGVTVSSLHLYLYAAKFYGLEYYSFLINPPNDPYASQMVYAKYVFPNHWQENLNHFKEYYNNVMISNEQEKENFPFEIYCEKTELFFHWLITSVPWDRYDLIGFSLNYGQFLPSLAIAQYLKSISNKKYCFWWIYNHG